MPSQSDRESPGSASMYSLRDLLSPLFRRWRFTTIVFLLITVVGIALAPIMGSQYTSKMAILVSRERQDPLVSAQQNSTLVTAPNPIAEEEVNSEVELLQSPDVLRRVVLETGLNAEKPGLLSSVRSLLLGKRTQEERTDKAVTGLAAKLKIEVVIKTNVIDVSYTSGSPKLSYAVVSSLERNFEIKEADVHRPSGSSNFFAVQTENYQQALGQSEADLNNFSATSMFSSPDLEQGSLAAQVTSTIGAMEEASQAIASDNARIATDKRLMSTTPERSPTTISNADADAMVGNVLLVLLAAQSKQTDLHAKYAPSYPAVKEADKEVADAKAALQSAESLKFSTQTTDRDPTHELVREDLAKTEADRDSQRARQEAMEASLTALKAKLVELDKLAIKRNDLVRDVRANEQNYLLYLSKREQERMSDALNNAKIANVAIVGAPTQPVLPNIGMPTLIVLVVFGAFIFSIIATYALAYTDSSVYTPDQVLEILDVPMVVAVRTVA